MQPSVTILPWHPDRAGHFDRINREWIQTMFVVEPIDDVVLRDPATHIIEPGGDILFAALPSGEVVGAGALRREADGIYELTKMGVTSRARGHKVGEALLHALIARAQELNAATLYLLTNSDCEAAIHLYEKNGFAHDRAIAAEYGAAYQRSDVAMRYEAQGRLDDTTSIGHDTP